MSDRAKKVSELSEVTSITASDTLLYVVTGANSTPLSKKMKVSSLLSNVTIGTATITTLTANTINVVNIGNTSTTLVANTITATGITTASLLSASIGNTSSTLVGNTVSSTQITANVFNVSTQIKIADLNQPTITAANGYPWLLAYGNAAHFGTEITWSNAQTPDLVYDAAVTTHTAYISNTGFFIDLDYNDANTGYVGWGFRANGSMVFPDGSVQNRAFSDIVYSLDAGVITETFVSNTGMAFNGAYAMNCAVTSIVLAKTPFNFFGLDLLNFTLDPGQSVTVKAVVVQNSSPNLPSNLYLGNATPVTVLWKGGSAPTPNANKTDVIEYFILNDAGTYTVLGELTTYG